jgi:Putative rRNA methylase
MPPITLPSCLDWAHEITKRAMEIGPPLAIDATVGNGYDTLHLAKVAGGEGRVWGFDVQALALTAARGRLAEAGVDENVTLIQDCHADMAKAVPEEYHGKISAIMFNLGYLPKGDHSIVTKAETTIPALEAALMLLRRGGVATVLMYSGHEGSEADEVVAWATGLDQKKTEALWYHFPNQQNQAPSLLCLERQNGEIRS